MPIFSQEQELILSAVTGRSREYISVHPELKLNRVQKTRFNKMQAEFKKGVPLAYVLGYRWFFGRKFKVNKSVLIPRPETEQLVELALEWAKQNYTEVIADIGTGSGAIIVSLAASLHDSKTKLFATDISAKALAIAKQNAKGLRINFKKGNLAAPIATQLKNHKILITANLPYLSAKDMREPSIKKEPKLALYGGKKSYAKIERLIRQLANLNPKNYCLLLEINYDQATQLQKIIKKHLPKTQVQIYKDLNNWDRIIKVVGQRLG